MSEHRESPEDQGMEPSRGDPRPELRKLVELSTQYPAIGPTVAELAHKVGCGDIGEQIVRLGLEGDRPGVEFYFVRAQAARRSGKPHEALRATVDGVEAVAGASEESADADAANRLLHLLRLGFAVLMFDLKDVRAEPAFSRRVAESLPKLENRLGQDPFYRSLLAQAYWFDDPDRSEVEWERAAAIDDTEFTWNARGTWYKEAERDPDKAEATYRRGLETVPRSALLLHNVAQLLVDRAEARKDDDPGAAHKLLTEADELLRSALREEAAKVRRHIHATRDRLHALRRSLPRQGQPKQGQPKQGQPKQGQPKQEHRENARGEGSGRRRRGGRGGRGREGAKGEAAKGGGGGPGERRAAQDGPPRADGESAERDQAAKPKEGGKQGGQGRRRGRGGREKRPEPSFQTDGRIRLGDVLMDKLNKDKSGRSSG